jgi:hypothetical protein
VASKVLDAFYDLIEGINEDLISADDRCDFIFELFDALSDYDCDLCELEGYSSDVNAVLNEMYGKEDDFYDY